jgi:hypothetical protein
MFVGETVCGFVPKTAALLAFATLGDATPIGSFLSVSNHQGGQGKLCRHFC